MLSPATHRIIDSKGASTAVEEDRPYRQTRSLSDGTGTRLFIISGLILGQQVSMQWRHPLSPRNHEAGA